MKLDIRDWSVEVDTHQYNAADTNVDLQIHGPTGYGYPAKPIVMSPKDAEALGIALIVIAAQARATPSINIKARRAA